MKVLIINKSIHHNSTLKIAQAMSEVIGAKLIEPKDFSNENIKDYDMIGFGSGIYDANFHKSVMDIVDTLPDLNGKKVFIFSTAGVIYEKSHRKIKAVLNERNATLVGDFYCKGFNTNVFLKYFGGMNKGRPNSEDMSNARSFAKDLI